MTAPIRDPQGERYEIYRVVTDMEALHEAFRDRVEDMDVSRLELDAVAGLTPGYSSKLLCDPPMKFVGRETLPKMLKGTGLAIALVVDDGSLAAKSADVPKRKYKIGRIRSAPSIPTEIKEMPVNIEELVKNVMSARMREIGMKGNKSVKRKAKEAARRARQRKASHAARMRWSKAK
jgi:hypothetical protein